MKILFFLLFLCIIELFILIKDKGKAFSYMYKLRLVLKERGLINTFIYCIDYAYRKLKHLYKKKRKMTVYQDKLFIAFKPTGGMGDYIISAKILEELLEVAPCEIDVYCEKIAFGKAIYGKRKNVNVIEWKPMNYDVSKYDLALEVEHFVHIQSYWRTRVKAISPELAKKIDYIYSNWEKLYVDIPKQWWRERIQFERCRNLGLDRWTELRMGEAFDIKNHMVYIPLDEEFFSLWNKYGYKKYGYITINIGADVMRIGQRQIKTWPKWHYEKLVKLIHERLPELKVIQLGTSDAERVDGCDEYVLGENIELAKWILRDSLCHIDCEGGLVHLATQLGTKCIVIFGPTPIHMYGYASNINLVNDVCFNCMGIHEDWAYCCYSHDEVGCMARVEPEIVMEKLMQVYNNSI